LKTSGIDPEGEEACSLRFFVSKQKPSEKIDSNKPHRQPVFSLRFSASIKNRHHINIIQDFFPKPLTYRPSNIQP
jgi:hypothetical protein